MNISFSHTVTLKMTFSKDINFCKTFQIWVECVINKTHKSWFEYRIIVCRHYLLQYLENTFPHFNWIYVICIKHEKWPHKATLTKYSLNWLWIYNQFHNILRLFNVLPSFPLPQVKRCVIITYKHALYELPHELPNDLRLRILGN